MRPDNKFLTDHGADELVLSPTLPDNHTLVVYDDAGNPYRVDMATFMSQFARASMRLATPVDQDFNDTTWTVMEYDTITQVRGDITADINTNSITVGSDGVYDVLIGVDAAFGGSEELNVMAFVNGSAYSPNAMAIQGRTSNKPVSLFWHTTVQLSAGMEIDVRGINGDSGAFTINMQRMYFSVYKIEFD